MAAALITPKYEIHCRGGSRTAPTRDFLGNDLGQWENAPSSRFYASNFR